MHTIPDKQTQAQVAEIFKTFGDTTRVQILFVLAQQESCVNEIAQTIGLSQSAVSHQLRLLKQMHLVTYRREGKNLWYRLADEHVHTILHTGLEHVVEC